MKVTEIPLEHGRVLEVHTDDNAESPRSWDNLGIIYDWHPRYRIGDKKVDKSNFRSADDVLEYIESEHDVIEALPVFLLDHSGLRVNTTGFSCPWDSGQVGWIVATRESLEACGHNPDKVDTEQLKSWLRHEIDVLDQYLCGDVYGFVIRDAPCPTCGGPGEVADSVWGFYGDDLLTNGMIDHLEAKDREALKRALSTQVT